VIRAASPRPSDYRHVALTRVLAELYEHQGKCERIKNFPYPRQFAALNLLFVWLFIVLVSLGLLQEFSKLGDGFVWFTIPAGVVVAWVFHAVDRLGGSSENPFEGGPNDVPIAAIAGPSRSTCARCWARTTSLRRCSRAARS
jgi:putative membrane protein